MHHCVCGGGGEGLAGWVGGWIGVCQRERERERERERQFITDSGEHMSRVM